jgi:hypothetical protein
MPVMVKGSGRLIFAGGMGDLSSAQQEKNAPTRGIIQCAYRNDNGL